MLIYISSSWKNRDRVREMANNLLELGYEVYDFTNPQCRKTEEIPPERFPNEFDPGCQIYSTYIDIPEYRDAVMENKEAIDRSHFIILLLPCGNDAHADWAYGLGKGKETVVVGQPRKGERSPVHLWADAIINRDEQVYGYLHKRAVRLLYRREKNNE